MLSFLPTPPKKSEDWSLISYSGTEVEDFEQWTNYLDEFLAGFFLYAIAFSNKQECTILQYTELPD